MGDCPKATASLTHTIGGESHEQSLKPQLTAQLCKPNLALYEYINRHLVNRSVCGVDNIW